MSKAILYGDISPNVIDGSSIWLVSMAELLAGIFDEVHFQLKQPVKDDKLMSSLAELVNVTIYEPQVDELDPESAALACEALVKQLQPTAVVCRGINACNAFCLRNAIAPLLWSYVTELPFPPERISPNNRNRLSRIAQRSRRLFAQTESARSYLEAIAPPAAGKVVLLNPMIPDSYFSKSKEMPWPPNGELRIVYSGKFARDWKTLEMLELPRALRKLGVPASLTVVGDKFNRDLNDPTWLARMQEALSSAHNDPESGVRWLGGLPRSESMNEIAAADLGLGWRTPQLDGGLEISTKALEYGACRTIPIINQTHSNEEHFGSDYPFFVTSDATVDDLAETIVNALPSGLSASARAFAASAAYSMEQTRIRIARAFERSGALASFNSNDSSVTKVVIASHDLKFMGELMDHLQRSPKFEVQVDRWSTLHEHDEQESLRLLAWADTIFCEWAGPSLAWYSKQNLGNTRLVSRLHRFELDGPWMSDVNWDTVSGMIFVSELYRRMALEKLPIQYEQTSVIPNAVDLDDFDRPKNADARFTLGFVGMVPIHKRPDRALTLLERLLAVDDRYILRFKGRMPWEYPYEWKNPIQKQMYLEFFNRIGSDPILRRHIIFDDFSADVASWQRNIGFILSPSEVESFHMAPAEGMAARSVPIFWKRPGVDEIFGKEFLLNSLEEAVTLILDCRDEATFVSKGEYARSTVARWDPSVLLPLWEDMLGSRR
ncbi:glycosyl transferase [Corynebacterium minutissimum]|uniref:Glycosyl transferases group 1 n=1 Tax=Corynebacterium minutissimum TaxID=38301 RepID=A0A376D156_9CORY|nr:glycosyl transferase [Corynebacterium minutissimum]QRP61481.1 hypothetical protein I6J26_02730 [Corynebacterium minutissimum]STC79960.1 Glycosyl transferases group 1 [Corynebacterium minutissimum]